MSNLENKVVIEVLEQAVKNFIEYNISFSCKAKVYIRDNYIAMRTETLETEQLIEAERFVRPEVPEEFKDPDVLSDALEEDCGITEWIVVHLTAHKVPNVDFTVTVNFKEEYWALEINTRMGNFVTLYSFPSVEGVCDVNLSEKTLSYFDLEETAWEDLTEVFQD